VKADRISRLISTLEAAGSWVSAATLSKRIGTTERTVRNYVREANARGMAAIESSKYGYRIAPRSESNGSNSGKKQATQKSQLDRKFFIISRLMNAKEPLSLFDLADELSVSESTLANTTLPSLRKLLARFDISLEVSDFNISVSGSEENVRRLVGYTATHNRNAYFSSVQALKDMFPSYDVDQMLESLVEICQNSGLFLNNYAFNNLLMHLIVILVRLRSGNALVSYSTNLHTSEIVRDLDHQEAIITCVDQIVSYAEKSFGVKPSKEDYRQIVALISLSADPYSNGKLTHARLISIVGEDFFNMVISAIEALRSRYRLEEFDEDFVFQFVLHLHNARQRIEYGVSCPNPIASQLKQDYAPVYDMSVFFVHQLSQELSLSFSEDEIGFVAYHLGAYLESHKGGNASTTCVVVFENYHDYADAFVARLKKALGDDVEITAILDANDYLETKPSADMLITTIGLPKLRPHTVLVSPLLSNRNVRKIRDEIDDIRKERRADSARTYLQKYLSPELYLRNTPVSGPEEAIRLLSSICLDKGYITSDFVDDVLLREQMSNTAFTDILAVPHAINKFALRSFVAVLHNDDPIPWGDHSVNLVMLIGLSAQDVRYFQDVLDLIIDLFLSPEKSMEAVSSTSFEGLVAVITTPNT
jgi:lichenan operon transcriptional antiterminator